ESAWCGRRQRRARRWPARASLGETLVLRLDDRTARRHRGPRENETERAGIVEIAVLRGLLRRAGQGGLALAALVRQVRAGGERRALHVARRVDGDDQRGW